MFWYHRKNTSDSLPVDEPAPSTTVMPAPTRMPVANPPSTPKEADAPVPASENERVVRELNGLSACVGFTSVKFNSNDLQSDHFKTKLQDAFGPIQSSSEDWSRRSIKTPHGEERSLKIEVTAGDDGIVHRNLTYYGSLDETEESIIHVSEELRQNPSETLIASLTSDGEIVMHEKFLTLYFATGEHTTLLERNGQIADFKYELNGKSFQCRNMDRQQGGCSCQP